MRRVTRALLLAALLIALPAPASAQAPVASWMLEGVLDRFCVSYLVEPGLASRLLGSRFTPVPAEQIEGLNPAVVAVVAGEPAYRGWIPGEVCLVEATRVRSGSRTVSEGGHPVTLGWWALSGAAEGGAPMLRGTLLSASTSLRRLATDQLIQLDGVDYSRVVLPGTPDHRRTLEFGGATLTWEGRVLDPPVTPARQEWLLAVDGKRSRRLAAQLTATDTWERAPVGNLKVLGESDLARSLTGSPIRMVEPLRGGGSLTIDFTTR